MLGKKTLIAGVLVAAGFSTAAHADGNTVLGAVLGGTLGATIGHSIGGRDAAVIGGVIGAAAGASIAESDRYYRAPGYAVSDPYYRAPRAEVVVVGPPRYYPPRVAPVVYAAPAPVYVSGGYYRADPVRYGDRDDRGWSHRSGDRDGYRHDGYRRGDRDGDDHGSRRRW